VSDVTGARDEAGREAPAGERPAAQLTGHPECLRLEASVREDAIRRLKSVRGHVDGVLRMLGDPDVYCVDVLKQMSAVQGALRKVSDAVLRSHVRDHVVTAASRGDTEHIVDELMEALKYKA
jgi:CsoR family transcriptional regulator, copper-sensing transcriptional repressor